MSTNDGTRLNKFISSSGHCSRREADRLIETNRVKINGRKPELGARVTANDEVTVDGFTIEGVAENKSDRTYLVYNKPVGITSTTDQDIKGNIVDAVDYDYRVFPIGRLDKASEGLILLTNDGDIVNKILRAENAHSKEYLVSVNKAIGPDFASKMSKGIPILGTMTKPCKVVVQSRTSFKITLTEGLNRQIRRMCTYLGYQVTQLQRVRIMHITLGRLKVGQWRNVTADELTELNKAIADSSSEASKPGRKKQYAKKAPNKSAQGRKSAPDKSRSTDKSRHADKNKKNTGGDGKRGTVKTKSNTGKPSGKKPSRHRSAKNEGGKPAVSKRRR